MGPPRDHDNRRRRWARRAGSLAVVLGGIGFLELGLTYFWQEPFSSFAARGRQAEVRHEVDRLFVAPVPLTVRHEVAALDPSRRLPFLAGRLARDVRRGHGLGRIQIPKIGVDEAFVQGTSSASLARGPGHYPKTHLPGERGTVGIAGHRTTYGAPFRHLDGLRRGDRITVTMPYGRFEYRVERIFEVTPDHLEVTRDVGHPRLVLTACTPLFSAARRIVVDARLAASEPASAAAPGSRAVADRRPGRALSKR